MTCQLRTSSNAQTHFQPRTRKMVLFATDPFKPCALWIPAPYCIWTYLMLPHCSVDETGSFSKKSMGCQRWVITFNTRSCKSRTEQPKRKPRNGREQAFKPFDGFGMFWNRYCDSGTQGWGDINYLNPLQIEAAGPQAVPFVLGRDFVEETWETDEKKEATLTVVLYCALLPQFPPVTVPLSWAKLNEGEDSRIVVNLLGSSKSGLVTLRFFCALWRSSRTLASPFLLFWAPMACKRAQILW